VSEGTDYASYIAWLVEHYEPGLEVLGVCDLHTCKTCGAAIIGGRALEVHATWHGETKLTPSLAVNASEREVYGDMKKERAA